MDYIITCPLEFGSSKETAVISRQMFYVLSFKTFKSIFSRQGWVETPQLYAQAMICQLQILGFCISLIDHVYSNRQVRTSYFKTMSYHHVPSQLQTLAIHGFLPSLLSVLLMSSLQGDSFLVTKCHILQYNANNFLMNGVLLHIFHYLFYQIDDYRGFILY